MFDTLSNNVIRIHKGDDSGPFTLFVNKGTPENPIKQVFYPDLSIIIKPESYNVFVDKKTFYNKDKDDGFYDFEYNYLYNEDGERVGDLGWYLDGSLVTLSDYGITIDGEPCQADHIIIAQFVEHCSEIYFYIVDINDKLENWLVKKTFYTKGEVMTEFADCRLGTLYDTFKVVDDDGNIRLKLTPEDTDNLDGGEYTYQIRANIYSIENDEYERSTITKRVPFIVIDGEESSVW